MKLRPLWCLLFWLVALSAQAHFQSNWLVGVSGGYSWFNANLPIEIRYPIAPPPVERLTLFQTDILIGSPGHETIKGLLGGYRAFCDRWLLDAEVNVDLYQPDDDLFFNFSDIASINTFSAKRRYKHGPAFGLSGRFGYVFSPYFIAYMMVGVETNKDKLEMTIFKGPFAVVLQTHKQQVRTLAGFGADIVLLPISPCLMFRLEYAYHSMDKGLSVVGDLDDGGVFNPHFGINLRPKFNSIKAALIWNLPNV